MPRFLTKTDIIERLHNHPLQNYALIANVAKGIALATGSLVLLQIFSQIETAWMRLIPWAASMALVLTSYMKWNRGILVSNARTNIQDNLFPFMMGVVEFLLFGVLSIEKDSNPLRWLNWCACASAHFFVGTAIVHNRIRLAHPNEDFGDDISSLRREYLCWLKADRLQTICGGILAAAVSTLNVLWIIPSYGTRAGTYIVCSFALIIAFAAWKPISDANRERERIDELSDPRTARKNDIARAAGGPTHKRKGNGKGR